MTRSGGWTSGVGPVEVELELDGHTHRILWRRGALVLVDHPDPAADAALGALGGERCLCLDVFEAWRHHRGRLLIEETAEPGPWRSRLRRLERVRHVARRLTGDAQPTQPGQRIGIGRRPQTVMGQNIGVLDPGRHLQYLDWLDDEFHSEVLRSLPRALFDVLVASRSVHAARNDPGPTERWSNLEATRHRVRQSVHRWLGAGAPRTIGVLLSTGPSTCSRNSLFATSGGSLEFVVPPSWLIDVWARGLAVTEDRFVLATDEVTRADQIGVITCELAEDRSESRPVIGRAVAARRSDHSWHLSPNPR